MKVRLNKYLANLGIASRRKVDQLIDGGRVSVNGQIIGLGKMINTKKDQVLVDGKQIQESSDLVYIVINKPKGIISTANDEFGRKSVTDLIKTPIRLYPVGRLDENSTGLVLLTNDGDLTYKITHPKFHIPKTYEITIQGDLSEESFNKFKKGVNLKEGKTAPAEVKIVKNEFNRTTFELIIHEGWYRQIRRMCAALNLELMSLKRLSIGPIHLGNLLEGKSRELTIVEIEALKSLK